MSIDKRKKKIWFSTKAGTDKTEIQPAHMPVFQKEGLPEFQRYVQEHLRYPSALAEKRIGGRVVVSFAVEKDGSVGQITVVQTPSKDLAAVVVRAVESAPKWAKPGLDAENNPVAVKYHLPVDFAIQ